MNPAFSVIVFTVCSGAGLGLMALLGISGAFESPPSSGLVALVSWSIAFSLLIGGLVSSTLHLGHPERAWRAMSQWRSSWLSREGLAAIVTILAAGLNLYLGPSPALGLLTAALAVLTVYCTAMIYASLKSIPAWCNGWVPAVYVAMAAMTGAATLSAIGHVLGHPRLEIDAVTLVMIGLCLACKLGYWRHVGRAQSPTTVASAIGIAPGADIRVLEPPHGEANYLTREMGFRIARKHAAKLRRITILCGFAVLFASAMLIAALGAVAAAAGVVIMVFGVLIERWLFFAEAKHAVGLYYGQAQI